jgi:hypothetical protein
MANANINESTASYSFEAPIPGQSLTNPPENKYAWEQPPEMTSQKEAINKIFLEIIKPENMETLASMMADEVPIANIAELLIKTGFQKGKFNPDLAITLMEPTMYMLLSVAEKVGIDPILSEDEDLDETDDPEIAEENVKFAKQQNKNIVNPENPKSLKELKVQPRNIPMSNPDLKKQLDSLDTSKVKESILQRKQPQATESLLDKTGV